MHHLKAGPNPNDMLASCRGWTCLLSYSDHVFLLSFLTRMTNDITRILSAINEGVPHASEHLFAVLYEELKRIAGHQMRQEVASHTLQPTALVHEAFLRLMGATDCNWQNRAHFFGAAAEAMRRILIEAARSKGAKKRGGGQSKRVLEDPAMDVGPIADEILDVNDAITALELEDPDLAEIVKLRFFGGLMMEQIAELKGQSKSTIERRWTFAKAWLSNKLD